MSAFWFFLSPEYFQDEKVILPADVLQHLKAARLKQGDFLVLSDGAGRAFHARLEYVAAETAQAAILNELDIVVEPPLEITLFLGISRGEKMDRVVRQSVELGVKKIVPVITERTIVRHTAAKGKEKAVRWQKIAASAASQCRRSFIPAVHNPLSFQEMLEIFHDEEMIIVPWEQEREKGLGHLAQTMQRLPAALSIFTGPEGGISFEEMEKLKKLPQLYSVTLGPRILRAETAPLCVLSILMFQWGDLGGRDWQEGGKS